jgi:hypothetical protein
VTFGGSCSCFAGPDLRIGREGRHDTTSACKSCTFFDSSSNNGDAKVENGGLCRYNPPVSQPEASGRGLWPVVRSDDWCGHHTEARHSQVA